MKQFIISMIALALCTGAAQAQQDSTHAMNHMRRGPGGRGGFEGQDGARGGVGRREGRGDGQGMAYRVHFSDQQKQQLKDINKNYRQQLSDLNKNLDITVREQRAKMGAIRKDHMAQVQALYTPEQKAEIQKMKDRRAEMARVDAKARAEKMKVRLGLSDDQAKKLADLRTSTFAKMKELHSNQSLTPEQKRDQMKTLVQNQREQLKQVLTPDQLKQMEEMHHGGREGRGGDWSK